MGPGAGRGTGKRIAAIGFLVEVVAVGCAEFVELDGPGCCLLCAGDLGQR